MICTNLCKLIDKLDIKLAFAVVFDLQPCTFFLNTGKMFSIQTGKNEPTEMNKNKDLKKKLYGKQEQL